MVVCIEIRLLLKGIKTDESFRNISLAFTG